LRLCSCVLFLHELFTWPSLGSIYILFLLSLLSLVTVALLSLQSPICH
jgi:hypothetical protein